MRPSENDLGPELVKILELREIARDEYRLLNDPICDDRLLWRAQTFRHLVHLVPRETILELGAGDGRFTEQLRTVTRGENPITSVKFGAGTPTCPSSASSVSYLNAKSDWSQLQGRKFNFVVALDVLDRRNCSELLRIAYNFLTPGGQVVFFESNPWNPVLKLKRMVGKIFRKKTDRRSLLSRPELAELVSELGFIHVFSVFSDFVYAPLNRWMVFFMRNLSILLENVPAIRVFAGSILLHAQKPPRRFERPQPSLTEHKVLLNSISVVVPCHNEVMNIQPLVDGLRKFYDKYLYEIILVDDNSTDGTAEKLKELAASDARIKPIFRIPPNGVGRAIQEGYGAATGSFVLSLDCDFQHLLPELRDIFDAGAAGYDVVVGSRFSRHSILLNYPWQKIFANRGFHFLAQIFLKGNFRDLTNNLKLMRREVLRDLVLTQPGFAINAETGFQPLLLGYRIKEVPISWIDRTPDMGSSSFKLVRVGGGYCEVLAGLWLRSVFGKGRYSRLRSVTRVRKTFRQKEAIEGTR